MNAHDYLFNNAISAALSAIEIYNKPDFKYREEVFCILITNAWELLLKAKLVRETDGNLDVIYARDNRGNPKKTRSGNQMTIDLLSAANKAGVEMAVRENLVHFVEIRDTAVHLFHEEPIVYLVYILGVAALRNFQRLAKEWFDRSLSEYSFYILPLGFTYQFKTLTMLELETQPKHIANIVKSAAATQNSMDNTEEFYFICEVGTQIKSAKKIVGEPHFETAVDPTAENATIVFRYRNIVDQYPLSYKEVYQRVKKAIPDMKQPQLNKAFKNLGIKANPDFAYFVFRYKQQEEEYKQTGKLPNLTSVYNEDAVRVLVEHLRKNQSK